MGLVLFRDVEKEARTEQSTYITELQPLITTTHLPSIKILFPTIQIEEYSSDGQVLGEIDQGDSSSDEFDYEKWNTADDAKSEASKKEKIEE